MLFLNIQYQNNTSLPQDTECVPDETGWWQNLKYGNDKPQIFAKGNMFNIFNRSPKIQGSI